MTLLMRRVDRLAIPPERRSAFASFADGFAAELFATATRGSEELAVVSTCERFEVYTAAQSRAVVALLDAWAGMDVASATGVDALRHLFRVASGLDSRIRGEPHVLGQVRDAFNHAVRRGAIQRQLSDAFTGAIRCGKYVRRVAGFDAARSDYVSVAIASLDAVLSGVRGRSIAVVGTGALATDVAHALRAANAVITVIGRHAERAAALAHVVDAAVMTLHSLRTMPAQFDAVVTAVAAPEPVIGVDTLGPCAARLFVDLGAAPNVDVNVDNINGITVIRLDDLDPGHRGSAARVLARAEAAVERRLDDFRARHALPVNHDHLLQRRAS